MLVPQEMLIGPTWWKGRRFQTKEKEMLFEVAIIKTATTLEKEELIMGPTPVLAHDKEAALVAGVLLAGEKLKYVDQARLKVLVRPFAP